MTYRMQILVDEKSRDGLRWLIGERNDSASKVVRDLVMKEVRTKKMSSQGTLDAAAEMLKTAYRAKRLNNSKGPTDVSINHDHYLYGGPKRDKTEI